MSSKLTSNWAYEKLIYHLSLLVCMICYIRGNPCSETLKSCIPSEDGMQLVCHKGITDPYKNGSKVVKYLLLCNWPDVEFDPHSVLKNFPVLEEISILYGPITKINSSFKAGMMLRKIVMNHLLVKNIPSDTFAGLQHINTLDLRYNKLEFIDESVLPFIPNVKVFLTGNEWKCNSDTSWFLSPNVKETLMDLSTLSCSNYDRKPLFLIMKILQNLWDQCPTICTCIMDHVAWSYPVNVSLIPFHTVNCSYRGLTEFPSQLPNNTTTLFLQGNKIKSLEPLATNQLFYQLNDVYLDNNNIKSLNALEGSNWIFTFRILSLRHNFISEIPTYALDDAFAKNVNLARVLLGHNPWQCDCTFVLSFQQLITKHHNIFVDKNDIRCLSDDGSSILMIDNEARATFCKEPIIKFHMLTALDILNITLASLIVLILGKLLYDYLIFKKSGKLPWVVMKIF